MPQLVIRNTAGTWVTCPRNVGAVGVIIDGEELPVPFHEVVALARRLQAIRQVNDHYDEARRVEEMQCEEQ